VNPQFHDEFLALIPLRFSDEISEEDWALLQIHMAYCDTCHERYRQYKKITSEVIPAMAGVAAEEAYHLAEESEADLDAAEQRLMQALNSIPDSKPKEILQDKPFRWQLLAATFALATGAFATTLIFVLQYRSSKHDVHSAIAPVSVPHIPITQADNTSTQALQQANGRIADLEKRLSDSESRNNASSRALKSVQDQLEAEHNADKQTQIEKEVISQQLLETQREATSLRAKVASGGADIAEQGLRLTSLETKVRALQTALEEKDTALNEKDRMLALDKDFLAHDRDIRDLIGARNLYIADINDTNESGRTAKQFGRIFYTKDKLLVFYGFDLDSQAGRKKDVSFQVWGSGSDRTVPVSLGLFYQDDAHKRWVLRCNDPKSLARLETVFVTVEPSGGSTKPTGKPLLRAYLQIQPNHP